MQGAECKWLRVFFVEIIGILQIQLGLLPIATKMKTTAQTGE